MFFVAVGGKCVRTLRVFCSNFVDIFLRIICLLHVPPHTSFHLRSLQWQRRKHLFFGLRITSFLRLCFACPFGRPTADFVLCESKSYDCCIFADESRKKIIKFSFISRFLTSLYHYIFNVKAVKQSYVCLTSCFAFFFAKKSLKFNQENSRNFTSLKSLDFITKMWKLSIL